MQLATQTIQLTWRTAKQLLADGDELVVDTVLGVSPDNRGISDIVITCLQLPLCGFATPETRSGAHVHRITHHSILCPDACALPTCYHVACLVAVWCDDTYRSAVHVHLQAGPKPWC